MPQYFPMDNLFLNIARGLVKGTSAVHKFGAVPSMSTNTTGTVWDIGDTVYPWSAWATAGTITIDRADAADANKQITVVGLDSSYNALTETITLTNATGNASTNSFIRICWIWHIFSFVSMVSYRDALSICRQIAMYISQFAFISHYDTRISRASYNKCKISTLFHVKPFASSYKLYWSYILKLDILFLFHAYWYLLSS